MTTALPSSAGIIGLAASDSDEFTVTGPLLAGSFPRETSLAVLLDQNADLPAFTLVGMITASKKLTKSVASAMDGSEVPVGITIGLYSDTGADQDARYFRTGVWNYDVINKDGSWSLATLRAACALAGVDLFFEVPATATPTEPYDV